jgi:signal transduction histidine kinase
MDYGWMLRAVGNVLDNALKYTPDDGIITLQSSSQDGQAVIGVHNTGSYIPSNQYGQILKMDETIPRQTSQEGTGKGLAVCKAVALGHGGKFSIYSSMTDGTIFRFELPSIQ